MRWRVWRYREGTEVQGAKRGEGEGEGIDERKCYTNNNGFKPPYCRIRAKVPDIAERGNIHQKAALQNRPSILETLWRLKTEATACLQLPGQQIPPKIPTRVNSSPNHSHVIHSIHSVPSPLRLSHPTDSHPVPVPVPIHQSHPCQRKHPPSSRPPSATRPRPYLSRL